jgi:endonuclease/exonuclease/phosphatase (EEP) superfamily protein YafD
MVERTSSLMEDDFTPLTAPAPERRLRKWGRRANRGKLRCALVFVAAAGLLASTRLSQLWAVFDVTSHFALHFGIVAAAFLIGYFVPRARVFTGLVLSLVGFIAIGLYGHVLSTRPQAIGSLLPGERELRVATFNTSVRNEQTEAVAREIQRLDADVVVLIEIGVHKRALLPLLRKTYPHQTECLKEDYCGMAIVSKEPIVSSEGRGIWKGPPFIRADMGGKLAGHTVIGTHTLRVPHVRAQFAQLHKLADFLRAAGGRLIVMGDFNATPFSRVLREFEERSGLRRLTGTPTWPGYFELPQLAIDHILVSGHFRLIERPRIGDRAGSDHYPVTLKLAVSGN